MVNYMTEISSKKLEKSVLRHEAQICTLALLLPRLLLLAEICQHISSHDVPYYWLLLQIKSPLLLNVNGGELFVWSWKLFRQCSMEELIMEIEKTVQKILQTYKCNILCFIDEAQILLSACDDHFEGTTTFSLRSLLLPILNTFCLKSPVFSRFTVVLSGTGLNLQKAWTTAASAFMKTDAEIAKYLITDFGYYDDMTSMQKKYVNQFIQVSPSSMQQIFQVLKGYNFP